MEKVKIQMKCNGEPCTVEVMGKPFTYDGFKYYVTPSIDKKGYPKETYAVFYEGLKVPGTESKSMETSASKFEKKMKSDVPFCQKVRESIQKLTWEDDL